MGLITWIKLRHYFRLQIKLSKVPFGQMFLLMTTSNIIFGFSLRLLIGIKIIWLTFFTRTFGGLFCTCLNYRNLAFVIFSLIGTILLSPKYNHFKVYPFFVCLLIYLNILISATLIFCYCWPFKA